MTFPPLIAEAVIPKVIIDPGGAFLSEHEGMDSDFDALRRFLSPANVILVTLIRNLNISPNIQGEVIHLDVKLKCFTERPGIN